MFPVRWLHILGMAVALGGAVVTWSLFRDAPESALTVAERYEWLFWGSIGVLVATGVGNLGAMAPAVPDSDTRWGTFLTAKLLGVLLLLALSSVRTVLVHRAREDGSPGVLRASYGATAVLLLIILALAEVLAHGA